MKKTLSLVSITVILLLLISLLMFFPTVEKAEARDITISDMGLEYFNKLDTGIYWYTKKGQHVPTKTPIDKNKPTIIYTHGWKPDQSNVREGVSLNSVTVGALKSPYKYNTEYYDYYIDNGYNVGVFFWNQLSDEGLELISKVDRKIWCANNAYGASSKNGEDITGMKYTTYDSVDAGIADKKTTSYNDPTNPKVPVSVLYGDAIIEALGEDYNQSLHLVGHSMGGQLTCAVSQYLSLQYDKGNIGSNLIPDRATLLDPYFPVASCVTGYVNCRDEDVENKPVFELAAEAVEYAANHGVLFDGYGTNYDMCFRFYASTGLGTMTTPKFVTQERKDRATKIFTENMAWIYLRGLTSKYGGFTPTHVMTIDYYFTTNYMPQKLSEEGYVIPQAKISNDDLKKIIGMMFLQGYTSKQDTFYMNDSTYTRVNPVDFTDLENPVTNRVYGEVTFKDGNKEIDYFNKDIKVVAKLKDEKTIEGTILKSGYYYIDNLPEEEVEIQFIVDEKVASSQTVTIEKGNKEISVKESNASEGQENMVVVIAAAEKRDLTLMYVLIGVAIALIIIIALTIAVSKKMKKATW